MTIAEEDCKIFEDDCILCKQANNSIFEVYQRNASDHLQDHFWILVKRPEVLHQCCIQSRAFLRIPHIVIQKREGILIPQILINLSKHFPVDGAVFCRLQQVNVIRICYRVILLHELQILFDDRKNRGLDFWEFRVGVFGEDLSNLLVVLFHLPA